MSNELLAIPWERGSVGAWPGAWRGVRWGARLLCDSDRLREPIRPELPQPSKRPRLPGGPGLHSPRWTGPGCGLAPSFLKRPTVKRVNRQYYFGSTVSCSGLYLIGPLAETVVRRLVGRVLYGCCGRKRYWEYFILARSTVSL